ncbi:MAG: recombinase family protein [Terriglobia bacterium]|nr:recombinase family protein [Terriglobia bacterium]
MAEQRFVTYYRVSTDRQGRSGLGLDAQRKAVNQFLTGRTATVIAEYVEIESGSKSDRPKLCEALDACQRDKATLLIAKLDRLARSVAFISALMEAKTNFLAVDMPHASRLVLHVMAAFAEHERELIRERTRAALAAAKVRGVRLGANGAALAEKHKADATAYAATLQEAIAVATDAGARTTRRIADHLNAVDIPSRQGGRWHPSNVARVLRRLRTGVVHRPRLTVLR